MCIVLAKYLSGLGFIGIKNRDRNYYPTIKIRKSRKNGIERIYIWDENTKYTEGLNEFGVAIISSSMATVSDEKGAKKIPSEGTRSEYRSPDGFKIRQAMLEKTCESAVKSLIEHELTGHTLIFNKDLCFLLEASYRNGFFVHKLQQISKDQQVVRTNHGILLPWAGHQRIPGDPALSRRRISSEVRKIIAEKGLQNAKTIDDCRKCILDTSGDEPQLNPCRVDKKKGDVFTTGQVILVPSELTLYYQPIKCDIKFDYNSLNNEDEHCFFKILKTD
jgi:hypothetical protein